MTLYYSLVFGLLVAEMITFFLLVAPLPTSFRKKVILFFKESPIMSRVALTLKFTFFFILILFVDSVNRVYRVQQEISQAHEGNGFGNGAGVAIDRSEVQARRFYAQRNMYLCGFTLFLSHILSQTYSLVLELADAREKVVANKSASDSTEEVARLKEVIRKQDLDIEHLKKQAKGLSAEYEKVSDELNEKTGVTAGNKKSD